MLEFKGDAIVLSGETGTKLKSEIIGDYYPLWWRITSGGEARKYRNPTTIIELNAGTGEDHIKDTDETILGSSGHALHLKARNGNTSYLTIILIEENRDCFDHLKYVIERRWPSIAYLTERKYRKNGNVYLFNSNLETALEVIDDMDLGNSIYFFDPLLFTQWSEIEKVARKRIKKYYKTGTEFIVFLFTSDWFIGRGQLMGLPRTNIEKKWSLKEQETVTKVNELYGNQEWKQSLLNDRSVGQRIEMMVETYRDRLHKWFRYVLPLPFEPKSGQTYHLFFCSNYERGVRITRDFYVNYAENPRYSPDNKKTYSKFKDLHEDKVFPGSQRSDEWKILWKIIKEHEEGICDIYCPDLIEIQGKIELRIKAFDWLESKNYITRSEGVTDVWDQNIQMYKLNWQHIKDTLSVERPPKLEPLSSR